MSEQDRVLKEVRYQGMMAQVMIASSKAITLAGRLVNLGLHQPMIEVVARNLNPHGKHSQ
jgi:hypothetical protein